MIVTFDTFIDYSQGRGSCVKVLSYILSIVIACSFSVIQLITNSCTVGKFRNLCDINKNKITNYIIIIPKEKWKNDFDLRLRRINIKRCAKFESKFEWHFKKHGRVNKLSIDWRRVEKFRGYWTKRTELKISRTNIFLSNLLEEINKAKIGITLNNLRRFSLLRITSKVNRRGVLFIIESGKWRGRVPDRSLSISDSRLVSCKLDFPNESQMFDRPTILILRGNFTSSEKKLNSCLIANQTIEKRSKISQIKSLFSYHFIYLPEIFKLSISIFGQNYK